MRFIRPGTVTDHSLPKVMNPTKPSICFVCDRPGWAYDNVSRNLRRQLRADFNVGILYQLGPQFAHAMSEPYDLVMFHHLSMAEQYGCGRKYIVKLSGERCLVPYEGDEKRLAAILEGQHVVAMNNALVAVARKYTDKVSLIGNGLDLQEFRPRYTQRPDEFTVGFVANIGNPVRVTYKGFSFVDVACSDLGMTLKAASTNPRTGQAQIPNDKMPRFYNGLSCLAHPSLGEGSSGAIMEALACGLPVVTTKTGYHGDHLTDGVDGMFIKRDVVDVAMALDKLREDGSFRACMGRNARVFAEKHHDIVKVAAQWKTAIEEAIG